MRLKKSIAGGSCGAPTTHALAVSLALGRLVGAVSVCAWIVVAALVIQSILWVVSAYTDIRFETTVVTSAPVVVKAADEPVSPTITSLDDIAPGGEPVETQATIDPNRVPSQIDFVFRGIAVGARAFGAIGTALLLPLIALGVLLAASSATAGIERTVTSFVWALVAGLMILPVGNWIGLPWTDGALWDDGAMMAAIGGLEGSLPGASLLARYLLLPAACVAGMLLTLHRFHAGVASGLVQREDLSLDPALELEAGNVKPTSLHGGRAAAALSRVTVDDAAPAAPMPPAQMPPAQMPPAQMPPAQIPPAQVPPAQIPPAAPAPAPAEPVVGRIEEEAPPPRRVI